MRKFGSVKPSKWKTLKKLGGNYKVFFIYQVDYIYQLLLHRLHREALKQSATDPLSGKIDVGILTTGLSSAARKRRVELAQALKKLIDEKGKVPTINYQKLLEEMKASSQVVRI